MGVSSSDRAGLKVDSEHALEAAIRRRSVVMLIEPQYRYPGGLGIHHHDAATR